MDQSSVQFALLSGAILSPMAQGAYRLIMICMFGKPWCICKHTLCTCANEPKPVAPWYCTRQLVAETCAFIIMELKLSMRLSDFAVGVVASEAVDITGDRFIIRVLPTLKSCIFQSIDL